MVRTRTSPILRNSFCLCYDHVSNLWHQILDIYNLNSMGRGVWSILAFPWSKWGYEKFWRFLGPNGGYETFYRFSWKRGHETFSESQIVGLWNNLNLSHHGYETFNGMPDFGKHPSRVCRLKNEQSLNRVVTFLTFCLTGSRLFSTLHLTVSWLFWPSA